MGRLSDHTATIITITLDSFAFNKDPDQFSCGNCWRMSASGPDAAVEPSSLRSGIDSEVVLVRCSAATTFDDRLLDAHTRSLLTRTLVIDQLRWSAEHFDIVSEKFDSLTQRRE